MKIVHVCNYFFPWRGYQEFYLVREQIRMGHDVTVLTSNHRWPRDYPMLAEEGASFYMPTGYQEENGIPTVRFHATEPIRRRLFMRGISAWIQKLQPDWVLAHGYLVPTTFYATYAKKNCSFQLIVDDHMIPSASDGNFIKKQMRNLVSQVAKRTLLSHIDDMVAIAAGTVDWLCERNFVPREHIHYIPLGVDVDHFTPDSQAGSTYREHTQIPQDAFVFSTTGRLAEVKKIEVFIDALGALSQQHSNLWMLIVGGGDETYVQTLQQRAHTLGIKASWHSKVSQDQLPAVFNAADVLVWPADCTISHFEAMSCGKPIIIGENPAASDRIEGGNGLEVAVGDVSAMVAAMQRIYQDDQLCQEMGEIARRVTVDKYSWRRHAQRFDEIHQQYRHTHDLDS
jgi:glycosyltransferase involved in cell wall biosynthesis